jgi:hypothetical protein
MPRLLPALAAALALAGCSRNDEVVVAAPAGSSRTAGSAAAAPPPVQPDPVQGDEPLPPGHPPLGGAPSGEIPVPGGDGGMGMQGAPPHGAAMSAGADAGDVKVPRAAGPDARTIAELFAQRAALQDRTVKIRGKVVKFTPGVMGKNWMHLRDGTGSPGKDNDVTVTTQATAARGDVVVVEGKVALDQDIGMGAPYPIIIQDATVSR